MRTLMLLACCWWVGSFSPLPGSASPAGFGASGASGVTRGTTNAHAVTVRHVLMAARKHNLPLAALAAVWERECGLRAICDSGDSGQSYGPFQIKVVAAIQHNCLSGWTQGGARHADCAGRILSDWHRATSTWALAFTAYHKPENLRNFRGKPSSYGQDVYHKMLRLHLQAQRMLTRIL